MHFENGCRALQWKPKSLMTWTGREASLCRRMNGGRESEGPRLQRKWELISREFKIMNYGGGSGEQDAIKPDLFFFWSEGLWQQVHHWRCRRGSCWGEEASCQLRTEINISRTETPVLQTSVTITPGRHAHQILLQRGPLSPAALLAQKSTFQNWRCHLPRANYIICWVQCKMKIQLLWSNSRKKCPWKY